MKMITSTCWLTVLAATITAWVFPTVNLRAASPEPDNGAARMQDDEQPATRDVELADGKLALQVPRQWQVVTPRVQIIEAEFSIPADEGERPGRLTISSTGGTIEQNLQRWRGQFRPDEGKDEVTSETDELTVDGMKVHLLDLTGTYIDGVGPVAPRTERPEYRMIGAVVETRNVGNYYFKFYGPRDLIGEHRERFITALRSIKRQASQ